MTETTDENGEDLECPEYGCGLELPFEEMVAHLQWDHNRSKHKAKQLLQNNR